MNKASQTMILLNLHELVVDFRAKRRIFAKRACNLLSEKFGFKHFRDEVMKFYVHLGMTKTEISVMAELTTEDFNRQFLEIIEQHFGSFCDWLNDQT